MTLSVKITRIIAAAAIVGMLAAPVLASTTIHGIFLTGNGNGTGDRDCDKDHDRDQNKDQDQDRDHLGAVQFITPNTLLLASGENGNGTENGTKDRDRSKDRDC